VSLKFSRKLLAVSLILLAAVTYAEEKKSCAEEKICSYFLIGGEYAYVDFKPDDRSSFQGNLGGAQISYEYRPSNSFYEGVKFNWQQGEMHGTTGTRHLLDFNTQVRIGYTGALKCEKFLFTPFTGFGWRYFGHNLKQPGQSPVHFYYNEVYIPVGLLTDYKVKPFFFIGLYATWMPQVFPTVTIQPIGNARWVIKNTLANVLVELPLTFNFTQNRVVWSLSLKPFFEYWQDGETLAKTTTNIALDLPGNTYTFLGAELNVSCSF
jgi:hypothetical protein